MPNSPGIGTVGSEAFDNVFSVLRNGWLLEDILSHVHPYVVRNNAGIPRFYFEGNINGFVAVSKESSLALTPRQSFD